jgi:hypothetical protein
VCTFSLNQHFSLLDVGTYIHTSLQLVIATANLKAMIHFTAELIT